MPVRRRLSQLCIGLQLQVLDAYRVTAECRSKFDPSSEFYSTCVSVHRYLMHRITYHWVWVMQKKTRP